MLATGWLHLKDNLLATLGPTFHLWMEEGGADPFPFPDCMTGMGGGQLTREVWPIDYTMEKSCV